MQSEHVGDQQINSGGDGSGGGSGSGGKSGKISGFDFASAALRGQLSARSDRCRCPTPVRRLKHNRVSLSQLPTRVPLEGETRLCDSQGLFECITPWQSRIACRPVKGSVGLRVGPAAGPGAYGWPSAAYVACLQAGQRGWKSQEGLYRRRRSRGAASQAIADRYRSSLTSAALQFTRENTQLPSRVSKSTPTLPDDHTPAYWCFGAPFEIGTRCWQRCFPGPTNLRNADVLSRSLRLNRLNRKRSRL
ncbi:hypothetical protein RSOLAG1IB_11921 [Rhizoctonia solani AG-1 IB]|uniref:Uncharacterized protein n=1 Tax=Thanatephorus cucumeris (strain AG1-IB / isolate 7/3/14) TaxID=1108050 RepID=A0A0B7FHM5_THACB|nr:hypothetical protein RSOLAG1IB_11921 [Rhizoctonia solani AG-1 IB]